MELRIAGAQIPAIPGDINYNCEAVKRGIDFAVKEKADVLLTPENSLGKFDCDVTALKSALDDVTAKACKAGLALALGSDFFEDDGYWYNQIRFYASDCKYLGAHNKVLLCGPLDGPPKGELERCKTKPLRTFSLKGITVGGAVCNDLFAHPMVTPMQDPHVAHQLAKMGARIIFHSVNGYRENSDFVLKVTKGYHDGNMQIRANGNKVWIVSVDNSYPLDIPCSTSCGVIDPDGKWVLKTEPVGEQFFVYTIEID